MLFEQAFQNIEAHFWNLYEWRSFFSQYRLIFFDYRSQSAKGGISHLRIFWTEIFANRNKHSAPLFRIVLQSNAVHAVFEVVDGGKVIAGWHTLKIQKLVPKVCLHSLCSLWWSVYHHLRLHQYPIFQASAVSGGLMHLCKSTKLYLLRIQEYNWSSAKQVKIQLYLCSIK